MSSNDPKMKTNFKNKISVILWLLIPFVIVVPSFAAEPSSDKTEEFNIDRLNAIDKNRIREIITGVGRDADYLTQDIHDEFWSIWSKSGEIGKEETQIIRDIMVGVTSKYMRYFYEDALWALSTGRPFKSNQRESYEEYLLNLDVITKWRIEQNEKMIEKIAYNESIKSDGGEVLYDENLIKEILGNLEKASERFDHLFTR